MEERPLLISLDKKQRDLIELCLDRGKQAVEISSQGQMTDDLRQLFDSIETEIFDAESDYELNHFRDEEQLNVHKL